MHFEKGIHTRANKLKAIQYYKKAANKGVREAQYKLGLAYLSGIKLKKNESKAIDWLNDAVDQGEPNAQNTLADLYFDGKIIVQDKDEALQLYLKSAKQGNKKAQFNLSAFYYDFSDTDNLIRSYQWGIIAQKNGLDTEKAIKVIRSEMSNSDINQANKYVKKCLDSYYESCF